MNNKQIDTLLKGHNRYKKLKEGIHIMENGKEIELKDMTIEHLNNTIECFGLQGINSPYHKELKRRKLK